MIGSYHASLTSTLIYFLCDGLTAATYVYLVMNRHIIVFYLFILHIII